MSNLINRFVAITALNEAQIEFDAHYWGLGEAKEIIDSLPTVNAVVIPNNATNGDMMKTLFKNAIIEERDYGVIIFSVSNLPLWYANKDWWNAPYDISELKGENKCQEKK